jgi:hypothetical protein
MEPTAESQKHRKRHAKSQMHISIAHSPISNKRHMTCFRCAAVHRSAAHTSHLLAFAPARRATDALMPLAVGPRRLNLSRAWAERPVPSLLISDTDDDLAVLPVCLHRTESLSLAAMRVGIGMVHRLHGRDDDACRPGGLRAVD